MDHTNTFIIFNYVFCFCFNQLKMEIQAYQDTAVSLYHIKLEFYVSLYPYLIQYVCCVYSGFANNVERVNLPITEGMHGAFC